MSPPTRPGSTPATTVLATAGVGFTVHCYRHDASVESSGVEAATHLNAVAAAPGSRRATMADPQAAHRATGFSGGRHGLDVELAPADLLAVTTGRSAEISR